MCIASKDVVGKVFAAFFPIMAFITSGFEHSVANMYYITLALLQRLSRNMPTLPPPPEKTCLL